MSLLLKWYSEGSSPICTHKPCYIQSLSTPFTCLTHAVLLPWRTPILTTGVHLFRTTWGFAWDSWPNSTPCDYPRIFSWRTFDGYESLTLLTASCSFSSLLAVCKPWWDSSLHGGYSMGKSRRVRIVPHKPWSNSLEMTESVRPGYRLSINVLLISAYPS
ncbi:hypothetical protein BS47DRAFT_111181 [Hydnum rufescens UP504]|uniref:Uncharacterized protein n=1 Tax=Hydnum rufescens UP504 TaxID=1448309 RepID=A0A9P6AQD3_9AGAM|nr:hypothetical protein BS47DRAFT_111181 [Hydnum rufescens UP504]